MLNSANPRRVIIPQSRNAQFLCSQDNTNSPVPILCPQYNIRSPGMSNSAIPRRVIIPQSGNAQFPCSQDSTNSPVPIRYPSTVFAVEDPGHSPVAAPKTPPPSPFPPLEFSHLRARCPLGRAHADKENSRGGKGEGGGPQGEKTADTVSPVQYSQ